MSEQNDDKLSLDVRREEYYRALNAGVDRQELDRRFGRSLWFLDDPVQCPPMAEFKRQYRDERGRFYMRLPVPGRWGVLMAKGSEGDYPEVGQTLEIIRQGSAEIKNLKVEDIEQPARGRVATMTLVCREL